MRRILTIRSRVKTAGLLVAGLLALSVSGCGPVTYVHHVVLNASRAVSAAKVHKAHKYAPYEYYGAVAYLKQARIRAGFGDFQVAVRYGRKSEKMAKKAIKLTKERIDAQTDVGTGTGTDPAPPRTGDDEKKTDDDKGEEKREEPEAPLPR